MGVNIPIRYQSLSLPPLILFRQRTVIFQYNAFPIFNFQFSMICYNKNMEFSHLLGMIGSAEDQVNENLTAMFLGTGALPIYATSAISVLIEKAACAALENHLPLGTTSVGASLSFKHTTATPVGHHVQAEAKVIEIQGRRITFKIKVFDEKAKVADGTHERFIVDANSFLQKIKSRGPVH